MASLMTSIPLLFDANLRAILQLRQITDGHAIAGAQSGQNGGIVAAARAKAHRTPLYYIASEDENHARFTGCLHGVAGHDYADRRLTIRALSRLSEKRHAYPHLGQHAGVLLVQGNAYGHRALA